MMVVAVVGYLAWALLQATVMTSGSPTASMFSGRARAGILTGRRYHLA
jgi:hypothetical protein